MGGRCRFRVQIICAFVSERLIPEMQSRIENRGTMSWTNDTAQPRPCVLAGAEFNVGRLSTNYPVDNVAAAKKKDRNSSP
jgi:hypothetical protein